LKAPVGVFFFIIVTAGMIFPSCFATLSVVTDLRKTLLALGLYLLLELLQLRFELRVASASYSSPAPRVGRAASLYPYGVRPLGFLPPQGGQVIEAVLAAPAIIRLPPGWADAYRPTYQPGRSRHGGPILSLRDR
jgi:hypothetical protein